MAYEDDYIAQLNLGSKSALQSAIPTAAPSAASNAAMRAASGTASEEARLERVLPSPPPGYIPGPASPTRWDIEDRSPFQKFADGYLYSTTGRLPLNFQLRIAQQEADMKRDDHKLALDNYYKNNEMVRDALKSHSRDAMKDFLTILPNIKAQISATPDPEEQDALTEHWAKAADSMSPGSGQFVKFFRKNQSNVYAADAFLSDPDPAVSKPFLDMQQRMGYFEAVQSKEWNALASHVNLDRAVAVRARLPHAMQKAMSTNSLPELEFRAGYKKAMIEQGLRPVVMTASELFLDTEAGQNFMINAGVVTTELKKKGLLREKPGDIIKEAIEEDFIKNKAILKDAETNKGKYTEQYLAPIRHKVGQALGYIGKDTSPGVNVNNPTVQRFDTITKGEFGTWDDVPNLPEGPLKERAYAARAKARSESDIASASAQRDIKMSTPGDTSAYIYADQLKKTGRAVGVKGEVSTGELLTNKNYIKATPDQKKQLSELNIAQLSSYQIFDEAAKAFKGNAYSEALADATLTMEDSLLSAPLKAAAKQANPGLAIYVSRREATLGKFARSISGEVGVLTQQDVGRVKSLFPIGGDSTPIRTAKKKSLDALLDLNRRFTIEVLAGELSPEDSFALKNSEPYKSAINGIFGSVEGLPTAKPVTPQSNPSGSKSGGVNSLMQELEAGR